MGIMDIIPWRVSKARPVERQFYRAGRFPFQKNWLSQPAILGGTTFREPDCEVVDAPGHVVLTARLPGVRRKDIHVSFRRKTLFLRAERRAEDESGLCGIKEWERSARSYYRGFKMPVKVHPEKAKVTFRKGVLRVRLPKCDGSETPSCLEE